MVKAPMEKDLPDDLFMKSFNPFTLKFSGEWEPFEQAYFHDHGMRAARHMRPALLLGVFLYGIFGALDVVLAPQQVTVLWFIRYVVVCPAIFGCFLLSFWSGFKIYSQQLISVILILSGSGISVMVAVTPPPATFSYYAGVILVLMLGYGFSATRFLWASFAGWSNLIIYEIVAIWVTQTPGPVLFSNSSFFISANLIGMFSGYAIEFYMRKDFFLACMLESEREKIAKMNSELEETVQRRTFEIMEMNKDLQSEINARNQADHKRKNLERELHQAQKMESIGNLAGGIAHDFNNILSSILGYTELSLDDVAKDSLLEKNLQEVYTAGIRARDLVRQILAFARQSHEEVKPVQVSLMIKEVLQFIRSSIPVTIKIKQHIKSLSLIMGNSTQLHQILMNLCTNSAHAMEDEGGVLDVSLKDIIVDKKLAIDSLNLKSGDYIQLIISDTGVGIAPEIINSIFDPYFTTKGPGEGTGMGLAVVHGIVESYNGKIVVESSLGKGTTFILYFPITGKEENTGTYESLDLPLGTEKILFVDDEAPIAKSVSRILEGLGYEVVCQTNSVDALYLFRSNPDEFDLLVTDMTMPGMTGDKLAMEMVKIKPNLPVILCTGYSKNLPDETAAELGNIQLAYKPITKNDLAIMVRQKLDEAMGIPTQTA